MHCQATGPPHKYLEHVFFPPAAYCCALFGLPGEGGPARAQTCTCKHIHNMYIYVYVCICMHSYVYMYLYVYIQTLCDITCVYMYIHMYVSGIVWSRGVFGGLSGIYRDNVPGIRDPSLAHVSGVGVSDCWHFEML